MKGGLFITVIRLLLLAFFLALYFITKNYKKEEIEELDKKEHPLKDLYPTSLFLLDKLENIFQLKKKRKIKEKLTMLYVGQNEDLVLKIYYCKKIALSYGVCFVIVILSFVFWFSKSDGELIGGKEIHKPSFGEGSKQVNLGVTVENEKEEFTESNLTIDVPERRYTYEQTLQLIKKAEEYIDQNVLGENTSPNKISKKLNLMSRIPGTSMVVGWSVDDALIDSDGTLLNDEVSEEGALTELTATLDYYGVKADYTFSLNIMPKEVYKEDQILSSLKDTIAKQANDSLAKEQLTLPDQIDGHKVYYDEEKDNSSDMVLVIGIFVVFIIYFSLDKELSDKIEERNIQLAIDYPEIINKFTLLLGAGMTMKAAWGKITSEYEGKIIKEPKLRRFAYDEMLITWHELALGVTEVKAYERFGRRVRLLPYLKFSSLIAQNMKKGSSGLLELLEYEAIEAFQERKELAKRLGEKAGTKLLGPMMIMLVIVLFIIMIPAFMTLGN